MSMISAQIDELREMAGKLESYDQGYGTICQALRDAADTIWQLRDDLQRANDAVRDAEHDESMALDRVRKAETENAKLRERVAELDELLPENGRWYRAETVEAYVTEIAKLRELVQDMWRFTGTACKKYPRLFDPAAQGGQMVQPNMIDAFEQRMRELGVEVDE